MLGTGASETVTRTLDDVIEELERVRRGLCCYMGPTCDCKYGFPSDRAAGTEQTGCPELRDAIALLRRLKRVMGGELLQTYQEWSDIHAAMAKLGGDRSMEKFHGSGEGGDSAPTP